MQSIGLSRGLLGCNRSAFTTVALFVGMMGPVGNAGAQKVPGASGMARHAAAPTSLHELIQEAEQKNPQIAASIHVYLLKIRKDLSRHELYFFPNSLLRCSLPCSHYSLPCVRSFVRALTSSSRSWLCAIKSGCCNARRKSARDLRQRIVSSGSRYPASGAIGARCWCSSSRKRLWPGIAKAFACFGLGRYGTDNPDGRRSRARFGT